MTSEHPGEMQGWMALAVALYRSGRVPELQDVLLRAFRYFQSQGVTGQSLKPLQELQVGLLNGDPPVSGPLGF